MNTTPDVSILRLINARAPLPKHTQLLNVATHRWENLSVTARRSANQVPNHLSDTEPFWLHAWQDLWPRLRVPETSIEVAGQGVARVVVARSTRTGLALISHHPDRAAAEAAGQALTEPHVIVNAQVVLADNGRVRLWHVTA
ncbi:hypothetical protein BJI67_16370 (plasmid) [Acidihalobacter aeolianus]|uniref:Uncharacterized protein n=1 Tax=Acidihalobacter aeolianus TaxID=2792603 RepID=A0A1D8KCX5_9GAMM|nr:hypothetical protein [Acidihalobacter aeolianus]AOV18813.1 hypothetical protein BJI67_16370 [Acidihalobacter aeolianus]